MRGKNKDTTTGISCQDKPSVSSKTATAGLTLVALVVTIVVLLILAGITLVYVFGDNGVFSKAQDAKNRTENAIEDEKEYMNGIGNTIDKHTSGIGSSGTNPSEPDTPTPEGPTISDSSSSSHTATTINYTWEQISKIAEAIAKSDSVNNETMEVKAIIDGTECTIGVGDVVTVKYGEEERRVRVLGFKHDDLVITGEETYGEGVIGNKASISFEFLDVMTGDSPMNSNNTNSGGWEATEMRTFLNGEEGKGKLSNKSYIKEVKKSYIEKYNKADSVKICNDYLWLLSASEVVNNGDKNGYYAYAIASEGSQYKYYQGILKGWNELSEERTKTLTDEVKSTVCNFLRSPTYKWTDSFCYISSYGDIGGASAYAESGSGYYAAPGFCI